MRATDIGRPLEILLIEDNPGDARLTREALQGTPTRKNLSVATDGVQAMAFLRREGKHAAAPQPDLILLDLNLPKKDGLEVLTEIKGNDTLKRIPVVMLSSSEAQQDILGAYNLHANCFITKPVDLDEFIRVVRAIEDFWLNVVQLPTE